MRTKVRTRLLKFTMAMEIVMAITILGAILASIALLICGSVEKFCCQWESFSIDAFMANAFLIVMGIEFVKMLMLHTYGAVIDVLLFFFRDHFRFRSGQKRMKTRAHTAIR